MARPKKDWKVVVFLKDKKKGEFNGDQLVEALIKAEEKIFYQRDLDQEVKIST